MKYLSVISAVVCVVLMFSGCGVMRSLTTKHFGFDYGVTSPPAFNSPTGTQAGHPAVFTTSVVINDDLITKFDSYHGGIDWAGLAYTATLLSGAQVNLKFLASLTPPDSSGGEILVPADAVQLEDFTLTSAQPTLTVDETAQSPNAALRTFLDQSVRAASGSMTVYLYFEVSAPSGGGLKLQGIRIKGLAHGSLF